ncbi:MAG: hypothetical protein Q7T96_02500 [Methylobacter sp.]|nr:hypothetical protein [Methylobacter sp.]
MAFNTGGSVFACCKDKGSAATRFMESDLSGQILIINRAERIS